MRLLGLFSVLAFCMFPFGTTPPGVARPAPVVAPFGGTPTPSHQQPSPEPASQAVQPQPAQSGQGQLSAATSETIKLEPEQLQDLMQKVYLVAFRFTDLLTVLQPDKWKMDDAARQSFNQTLETVRGQLKTLDENRTQLLERPESSDLADKTDASITALLPNIEAVATAVTQYDGPAQGTQYKQPGDQLRELRKSLQPYALYLRAQAGATPPQPQTPPAPSAQPTPAQTQQSQPVPAANAGDQAGARAAQGSTAENQYGRVSLYRSGGHTTAGQMEDGGYSAPVVQPDAGDGAGATQDIGRESHAVAGEAGELRLGGQD